MVYTGLQQLFSGRVQRHTLHGAPARRARDYHLLSRAYLAWQISIFVPRMYYIASANNKVCYARA